MQKDIITQEFVQSLFDYDFATGNLIRKKTTSSKAKAGSIAGSLKGHRYARVSVNNKLHYVHHVVWIWHHGCLPAEIDHINRDRFDNRIENLRPTDRSANNINTNTRCNNKSGFAGICWDKRYKKWQVRIGVNNKSKHIGYYDDLDTAKQKREEAVKLHYEFTQDYAYGKS